MQQSEPDRHPQTSKIASSDSDYLLLIHMLPVYFRTLHYETTVQFEVKYCHFHWAWNRIPAGL